MNLVTIIIPMYNESNNIENCVKNLSMQSNQGFDVIFVDDGSIDNTVYCLKVNLEKNIKFNYEIIEQSNSGAAAARENGIRSAKTDYIMILDCDDKISNDYVDSIYESLKKNKDVDLIVPNVKIESKNNKWSNFKFYTNDDYLDSEECILNTMENWYVHGWFTGRKEVFLKSYEEYYSINFNKENFINNDEIITRLNFKNSKKIMRVKSNYFYCYNEKSTTKKVSEDRYLMVNNAVILNKIFSKYNNFQLETLSELISVLWGTHIYKCKKLQDIENLDKWNDLLKKVIKETHFYKYFFKLKFKKKVQLIILKLTYLV